MDDRISPFRPDRRALLGGVIAWLAAGVSAGAQGSPAISAARLEELIREAASAKEGIRLARPSILGFTESKIFTRQVARTAKGANRFFAVVLPRHKDGLLFFKGNDKPVFFAMHRTDTHLRRVVSALNRDGKLDLWSGPEADADFAEQLAYWAQR